MSKELVLIAKDYMEHLGLPVRQGFVNDEELKFGKASQLNGRIEARFQVARIEDVVNPDDPINASYKRPFVFYSTELQQLLINNRHPKHHFGLTIMVHECVHYLQPFFREGSTTPRNISFEEALKIPHEYEAYLVMSLYFFGLTQIPTSQEEKDDLIQRFNAHLK